MDDNFDKILFIELSYFIKKNIIKNIKSIYHNKYIDIIYNNLNLCHCNDNELIFLNEIINIIKENNPKFSNIKIYLVVLYLYYGLVLEENTENYVRINDIKYIISYYFNINNINKNYKDIIDLIFEISGSDKNYCSKIRKLFFNIKSD
jgi:hypothetical protein